MAGAMLCEQASNFMAANEFAQAMDAAMQATKADELNTDAWRLLGEAQTAMGHYRPALCAYRKWLELCPESEDAVSAVETLKELLQQVQEAKYSDNSAA